MQDADTHTPGGTPRTRVVVLGSGWGGITFLRSLDPKLTSGRTFLLQTSLTLASHTLQLEAAIMGCLTTTTTPWLDITHACSCWAL